jgi:large subunit ribosomal protein L32
MRVNRSHSGNRRSHIKVNEPRLTKCECGAFSVRHRACQECGKYRGRQVIDVVARTERTQRRTKRREQTLREMGQESAPSRSSQEEATEETKNKKNEEK